MPIKNNQQHINIIDLKFSGKEQQYKEKDVWPERAVLQLNKSKATNKEPKNLAREQQKQRIHPIMIEFLGKEQQHKQHDAWPKRAVRRDKIRQAAKRLKK